MPIPTQTNSTKKSPSNPFKVPTSLPDDLLDNKGNGPVAAAKIPNSQNSFTATANEDKVQNNAAENKNQSSTASVKNQSGTAPVKNQISTAPAKNQAFVTPAKNQTGPAIRRGGHWPSDIGHWSSVGTNKVSAAMAVKNAMDYKSFDALQAKLPYIAATNVPTAKKSTGVSAQGKGTQKTNPVNPADNTKKVVEEAMSVVPEQAIMAYSNATDIGRKSTSYKNGTVRRLEEKYNINAETFGADDFLDWARNHNFEISPYMNGAGDYAYHPKGQWQIGPIKFGKKQTTDEEDRDFETLKQLSANNERRTMARNVDNVDAATGAFTAGIIGAGDGLTFGLMSKISEDQAKKAYQKSGLPAGDYVSARDDVMKKNEGNHPVASFIGKMGGSLAVYGGVNKAVGGAMKGVPWISKMPLWVQRSLQTGVTNAIVDGTKTYSGGGDAKAVVSNAGISFLGGIVGELSGEAVGGITGKIIDNTSLRGKIIPAIAKNVLASEAYVGGNIAATYYLYPEEYRPTAKDIGKAMLTTFAISSTMSTIDAMQASKASKEYLESLTYEIGEEYRKINYEAAKAAASGEPIGDAVAERTINVVEYNKLMKAYLTGKGYETVINGKTYSVKPNEARFIGQNKYIEKILAELDTVTQNALDSVSPSYSGKGSPSAGNNTLSPAKANGVIALPPSSQEVKTPTPQQEQISRVIGNRGRELSSKVADAGITYDRPSDTGISYNSEANMESYAQWFKKTGVNDEGSTGSLVNEGEEKPTGLSKDKDKTAGEAAKIAPEYKAEEKRSGKNANGVFTNDGNRDIIIKDEQFGKKIGKHAQDWGLDASNANDREQMKEIIKTIIEKADEIRHGDWRSQPGTSDFYIKGDDVVVCNNGEFVTILKGGINNARVKNARK